MAEINPDSECAFSSRKNPEMTDALDGLAHYHKIHTDEGSTKFCCAFDDGTHLCIYVVSDDNKAIAMNAIHENKVN